MILRIVRFFGVFGILGMFAIFKCSEFSEFSEVLQFFRFSDFWVERFVSRFFRVVRYSSRVSVLSRLSNFVIVDFSGFPVERLTLSQLFSAMPIFEVFGQNVWVSHFRVFGCFSGAQS